MIRILCFLIFLSVVSLYSGPDSTVTLNFLTNPDSIVVKENTAYITDFEINLLHHYPYAIQGKKIYQLLDDDTGDGWVLHIQALDI